MNKYQVLAEIEFTIIADTKDKAIEIADDKLVNIPENLQITGVSISEEK